MSLWARVIGGKVDWARVIAWIDSDFQCILIRLINLYLNWWFRFSVILFQCWIDFSDFFLGFGVLLKRTIHKRKKEEEKDRIMCWSDKLMFAWIVLVGSGMPWIARFWVCSIVVERKSGFVSIRLEFRFLKKCVSLPGLLLFFRSVYLVTLTATWMFVER